MGARCITHPMDNAKAVDVVHALGYFLGCPQQRPLQYMKRYMLQNQRFLFVYSNALCTTRHQVVHPQVVQVVARQPATYSHACNLEGPAEVPVQLTARQWAALTYVVW